MSRMLLERVGISAVLLAAIRRTIMIRTYSLGGWSEV